jgi:molybdopterin synthase catalytic subunit
VFALVSEAIDPDTCRTQCADAHAGALAVFEGWVRDHNEGRAVLSLEYEGYAALANSEGNKILLEAREKFTLCKAVCLHRVGHLQIGDRAVWVGASSAHRQAAFDACQYIIDEVKARVPIWKKEHYADGDAEWVDCAECARHHGSGSA